jgi:pimeloyl-ACP methyl ester carboxylesterase
VLGQSFGGFVSLTYLSFYSDGLREVFMTGGMAPLGKTSDEVYTATYRKAVERNKAYFKKYPEDAAALQLISQHLYKQPDHRLPLPGGGFLTFKRVLTFGYMFGFHGGLDATHTLLLRMRHDLERVGVVSRPTLVLVEQFFPLDVMPIYAILHEQIYCFTKGVASRWAAQRVGAGTDLAKGDKKHEFPQFSWLADDVVAPEELQQIGHSIFLSTEMIYPFMFDTYPELMEMKAAAEILAAYDDWEDLYDEGQLAANRVPVYAATYIDDLYVDYGLAKETASKIGNIKVYETNGMYHNAIRARTDEVLTQLFRLRDDTID